MIYRRSSTGSRRPATADGADRKGWEAGSFYARILQRAWSCSGASEPARVLAWLQKRCAFRGGLGESRAEGLRAAMQAAPERLSALAEDFFRRVAIDDNRWLAFSRFREATLFELDAQTLGTLAAALMDEPGIAPDRRVFLFEISFSLSYQMPLPQATAHFDDLYERVEADPVLRPARDAYAVANVPANYFTGRSTKDTDVTEIRSAIYGW
jgi:hypothetical protein